MSTCDYCGTDVDESTVNPFVRRDKGRKQFKEVCKSCYETAISEGHHIRPRDTE